MEAATLPLLGLLLVVLPIFLVKLVVGARSYGASASSSSQPGKMPPALRLPPGPRQLPLIGSLHHLLLSRHGDLAHRTLRELSSLHGPLMMLRLGAVPTLVVSSAEAAREVMRTHDAAFASRHQTPTLRVFSAGGRDILFSPYGDLWRQLRRICVLELFSARRVQSFRRIREEEAAGLLRSVADSCSAAAAQGGGSGAVVDIGERICRAMNDTIVRSAVGGRCPRRDDFLRELHRAVKLTAGFNLADLYPSSRLVRWLSRALRETERCNQTVRGIMAEIIREQPVENYGDDDNLLAVLLRLQRDGDAQCPLTTEVITTVIMEIFAAGSETSSTALEWALSELTRNPRVMHKAQSEVREAFNGQHKLTEPDTENLRYLPLVIKETLRLHIPVPFLLPRECREPCRVMGYDIPKGTKVLVNAWAIARDGRHWEDAEEFRPERFEGTEVDFRGADFEFTPFGAGRRMCPGMSLGLVNMELALAGLLYHFDWELPEGREVGGGGEVREAFGITVKRKSKLVLHATPRVPCAY
ncbi:Ent-isokaurene C2-hydroxylase [Dichanthelium oligosanthes]|uniref:Ent-isokaurene C2-hydroxylase n=1 Tax=Dichanthelium oligosanthes TaxID=888268 RepID=A0A1E5VZ46_9POAL|nr:Ent-isokaurene C2-hydroxylase [Dichanthelium oligosanthes]